MVSENFAVLVKLPFFSKWLKNFSGYRTLLQVLDARFLVEVNSWKALVARKANFANACVRKWKRSARVVANVRKDPSQLSKRVENWGESVRAFSYEIVWGRRGFTRLKTDARATHTIL